LINLLNPTLTKIIDDFESDGVRAGRRWVISSVSVLLAIASFCVAWPIAGRLQFDRTITSMFDPEDQDLRLYQRLQDDFGGNAVAMLVYRDDQLWTAEGIIRNETVTQAVAKIPGVDGVISPSVLNDLVKKVRPGSFLSGEPPLTNRRESVARGFDQMFVGYTHSPDHQHGAVVAMLDPTNVKSAVAGMRLVSEEMNADGASAMHDFVLVGEPVLVEEAFDLIERDGQWLATLTVTLLSLVVLISLLDLRFVALSILVITWSVTTTKAVMQTLGMELSLVSTILTAIVTVITVTSVLHMGVRYRIVRRRRGSPVRASLIALALLATPILWTCLTDAAGFAALSVSRILPVEQFGWMIAIASISTLIGLALWAPTVMAVQLPKMLATSSIAERVNMLRQHTLEPLGRKLRRWILTIASGSVRHVGLSLLLIFAAMIFIATGIGRTKTETSFLNNFRPDSEIVRAYERVETEFGGAGVWDIMLDAPDEITSGYLKKVRSLEQDLRQIDIDGTRLTKVISLADADAVVSRSGLMRLVSPRVRLGGMQAIVPAFYNALMRSPDDDGDNGTKQQRKLRLMLRSQEDISASEKIALMDEVRTVIASSKIGGSGKVTGYYVLMTRLIDQLISDGWRCFAASSFVGWLLLLISGRSWVRATIALLVNLMPALLVIAGLGWLGGKINMGSAMIAAVSIGLSIDGSVHFLTSYRRKRSRGHHARASAVHAAGNVGAAIVLATIALVIGFGGLATSEFVPTATFGLLVAVTLVIGAIVNLTLLPCLVAISDRH
jgi:predicted RND superfamily exporter protein